MQLRPGVAPGETLQRWVCPRRHCYMDADSADALSQGRRLLRPTDSPELMSTTGYRPLRWTPEDISRIRSHGLFDNVIQEVDRAVTLRDFGEPVENLRRVREPLLPLSVPEGLDLSSIRLEILQDYLLATSPVVINGLPALTSARSEGSNNWVISGSRTATGRPILANDPHRSLPLPSLRYIVHLKCPEFDAIEAGEPILPGISIGHNGRVAFGLTISKHGPVLFVDEEANQAFALRAAWLEPGAAPYLGSLRYLTATSVEEFLSAVDSWAVPSVNHVVADDSGNIAWAPRGLIPRRPNWDGTLPVPGDGKYEWDGFLDASELPTTINPRMDGWPAPTSSTF
jgi:penicillin amidase